MPTATTTYQAATYGLHEIQGGGRFIITTVHGSTITFDLDPEQLAWLAERAARLVVELQGR
jgi:hypothetical protein